jgi:hypothetical protein
VHLGRQLGAPDEGPERGRGIVGPTGRPSPWQTTRSPSWSPADLKRGGAWRWTVQENPREDLWARTLDYADVVTYCPSQRELAEAFGVPKTAVQRVLKGHEPEWQRLCRDLGAGDDE